MGKTALVVIDLQNDITKHYVEIIDAVNAAVGQAVTLGLPVVYIRHENVTPASRTFRPGTKGAALVPELRVVSDNVFVKTKSNALSSEDFAAFIAREEITDFVVLGADATACVKSTCFNMRRAGYGVTVLSDCVTSYDKTKIPEMLTYYESHGCVLQTAAEWSQT